ncbi:SCO3374 family protein [Streptomyces sp. LX-29]|uniref:SCO3374 family protein n=1 Tax=Streptomyces sp. LX-29 TaxID=2900152 RepID=UPI00240D3BC1|nr:SCO3374 family protein [Streptomyces sp. LX-29]WFB08126.1 SCO3374 family protein [Streptomyces sp. LX-29]
MTPTPDIPDRRVIHLHSCTRPAIPRPRAPRGEVLRRWYERELGWPSVGDDPVELLTGVRFDALELPLAAGRAVLRRVARTGPVAARGARMWLLVAAGGAEELPGLLDWLEWGGVRLDLTALGEGGRITAPSPVPAGVPTGLGDPGAPGALGGREPQEAAVWLRPPQPGCGVEPMLPMTGFGGDGGAPDLVRLVGAAATECHRVRLLNARSGQPFAFSYASRTVAGTRPRSLTS